MKVDNMDKEKILHNNFFASCSKEELGQYWDEMKQFYRDGWISSDTALGMMRDNYYNKYAAGVVIMEQDLLRAIACIAFEES